MDSLENNYGLRCNICGFLIFPDEFDFYRSQAVHKHCGLYKFKKGKRKESYEAYRFKRPINSVLSKDDYNARLRLRYQTDPVFRERKLQLNREWSKRNDYSAVRKRLHNRKIRKKSDTKKSKNS